ncbi:MAG: TetR/AcrR family transcriptional regulator [Anaerolineales bacterium]|jgi:AcrR family transcriptional regulator|nr:TetR/AcrR family transcriptional regulator [Anaerolineales bacterium]
MPRPKKTPAQLEATREKILDVALSILQESGPEALTSRAIAEDLGVAHMSLFTYFENHAAILRALRERELSKWQAQQQVFEQRATPENIVQVVEDVLRLYIDFARENPNLYRLAWVMPEFGIESPEENRQRTLNTVGHLAGLLQLGMASGVFENREPLLSAGTALAMVNTPYILFHNGRLADPTMRDRMVDEVFSIIMNYLKKK